MKVLLAAIALAALAHSQTIDDVPECAIPCLEEATQSETDCAIDDYTCVCENFEVVQTAATECVVADCGVDVALDEVLPAVNALCEAQGDSTSPTPVPLPSPTPAPSSASAAPTSQPSHAPSVVPTGSMPVPTNGTSPTGPPSPIPTAGAGALAPASGFLIAALGALIL